MLVVVTLAASACWAHAVRKSIASDSRFKALGSSGNHADSSFERNSIEMASSRSNWFVPTLRRGARFPKKKDQQFEEEFEVLEKIGRGRFGDILKVRDLNRPEIYAMKTVPGHQSSATKQEARMHSRVEWSENVVRLHETFRRQNGEYVLLTEYMPDGDLASKIREGGGLKDGWDVQTTFRQIVDAMKFCHRKGVVHLDVKPENMWCNNRTKEVKIGDFGMSGDMIWNSKLSVVGPDVGYMAPEVLFTWFNGKADRFPVNLAAIDVWALGITFYELLAGKKPWNVYLKSDEDAVKIVARMDTKGVSDVDIELPEDVDEDAKDLLLHMLDSDPSRRFTMDQVARHEYFNKRRQRNMIRDMRRKQRKSQVEDPEERRFQPLSRWRKQKSEKVDGGFRPWRRWRSAGKKSVESAGDAEPPQSNPIEPSQSKPIDPIKEVNLASPSNTFPLAWRPVSPLARG
jgi:serine/threonine protein kinase